MSRKRLPRNAPCPCGSGKNYENCCHGKGFEWEVDDEGGVFKSVPMSEGMVEVLQQLRHAFVDEYGREPEPDDLLFPDVPHPEYLEAILVEGMKAAGMNPALIHAFEKTGLLVTEENRHLIPDKDLDDWHAAIEDYAAKHPERGRPPRFPMGTVALYGPDDRTTTKIVAEIILAEDAEPIVQRWVGTDVTTDPKVQREIQRFFTEHDVKSVSTSDGNVGCPHEAGEDFSPGEDCPFCPFWGGEQDSNPWF
jgi:hypothetical protein